jgi:hypothetical protein
MSHSIAECVVTAWHRGHHKVEGIQRNREKKKKKEKENRNKINGNVFNLL